MRARLQHLAVVGVLGLAGCTGTLASLSPSVHDSVVDYDEMADRASNQVLLRNILRARDHAPLNVADLSTINGNVSLSMTTGSSLLFGPHAGGSANSLSPGATWTANPTFTVAPLNTQAFTIGLLQPISPTYFANKWNSGISQELLLLLAIKRIKLADGTELLNNPDSSADVKAFLDYVHGLVAGGVDMKALTVLEPIGPAINVVTSSPLSASEPLSSAWTTGDNNIYGLITGFGDSSFTAGNAGPAIKQGASGVAQYLQTQIYRDYPLQVALCTQLGPKVCDASGGTCTAARDMGLRSQEVKDAIAKAMESLEDVKRTQAAIDSQKKDAPVVEKKKNQAAKDEAAKQAKERIRVLPFSEKLPLLNQDLSKFTANDIDLASKSLSDQLMTSFAAETLAKAAKHGGGGHNSSSSGSNNQTSTTSTKSKTGTSTVSAQVSTASPGQSATVAVQAGVISAISETAYCSKDQVVAPPETEQQSANDTVNFAHIEWRSIDEVFGYLGAITRNSDSVKWFEGAHGSPSRGAACPADGHTACDTILTVASSGAIPDPWLTVDYRSQTYAIADEWSPGKEVHDHSQEVMKILNELVNSSKVSSDIPVTPQIQVVP